MVVVTPENVRFNYRLAGPFPRSIALFVDYVVIGLIILVISLSMGFIFGDSSIGFILITFFILQWGYSALLETFNNGQTPGKQMLRLRVVSSNGLPINAQQAFLRSFLRTADMVPFGFAGVLSMLFTKHFQRLGDLAAGTIVVIEGKQGRVSTPEPVEVEDLSPAVIPAKFRPDASLIEALTLYMSRRESLSWERQREVAWYLARHFIRLWSLPKSTDPDDLLCLIYEKTISGQGEDDGPGKSVRKLRKNRKRRRRQGAFA